VQGVGLCAARGRNCSGVGVALGRRTLAEIALAEQNYEQAERELELAFGAVHQCEIPLAEWRVRQTAARLHTANVRHMEADREWANSLTILNRLADSLGQDEPLRHHLLARVKKIEGESHQNYRIPSAIVH